MWWHLVHFQHWEFIVYEAQSGKNENENDELLNYDIIDIIFLQFTGQVNVYFNVLRIGIILDIAPMTNRSDNGNLRYPDLALQSLTKEIETIQTLRTWVQKIGYVSHKLHNTA